MTLEEARASIFQALRRCPACGEEALDVESFQIFQRAEFLCGAVFTRTAGSMPVVNTPCPAPSHVAVRGLEKDAARRVAKEAT